jgi:hypothetical protein
VSGLTLSNAQVLYPSMAQEAQKPEAVASAVPSNKEDPAAAAPVATDTSTDERKPLADALYSNPETLAKTYESTIGQAIDRFVECTESAPDDRTAMLRDSAVLFNEIGMSSDQASGFMDHYVGAMTDRPITDEQLESWNTQVKSELTAQYGAAGYEARLTKAREYVKSVPGLGDALEISGLGSHPRVVAALLERANNLRPRKSK